MTSGTRTERGHGFWTALGSLLLLAFGDAAPAFAAGMEAGTEAETLSRISLELEPSGVEMGPDATRRISFVKVLELALDQNLDLALALAEEELARARAQSATARLIPEFSFGAGTARTDGRVQASFGELQDADFDTVNPQLALTYRVNLGARINDAIAERRELDAVVYNVLSSRQRLLLRVAELYNDLALAQLGVQVARRRAEDSEQFLKIAAARQRAGIGLGSDVARARVDLAGVRQEFLRAREIQETTSIRLAVVLRLDPGVLLLPDQDRLVPLELTPPMEGSEAERSARQRPDVKAAQERAAAAGKRFFSAWWDVAGPEVGAELRETYIGEGTSDLGDRRNVGAFVSWTLSLEKLANVLERRAERTTTRLRALQTEERAAGEAHRVLRELRAARETLPFAQDGLEAAEQNHRISLAQFKSGTAIALEVFDAADQLAGAQLDLGRSIVDYSLSQVRLLAAVGTLRREFLEADKAN